MREPRGGGARHLLFRLPVRAPPVFIAPTAIIYAALNVRELGNKVCVVTGAGSGIGRALALNLAAHRARLALSDIDLDAVTATAVACEQAGATARPYALDVSSREAVYAHADEVLAEFGTVNLVINNAGVALHKRVREMTVEDLEWVMAINFWGVVYGSKAFLEALIASGEGHIVNISSVFGLISVPSQSGYNASKFAVRGFTDALRQEMLADGLPVAVSCVHPGGVRTAIARNARTDCSDSVDELAQTFERIARTSPDGAARTIIEGVRQPRPDSRRHGPAPT